MTDEIINKIFEATFKRAKMALDKANSKPSYFEIAPGGQPFNISIKNYEPRNIMTDEDRKAFEELKPCPICAAGETRSNGNYMPPTMNGNSELISWEIHHFCTKGAGVVAHSLNVRGRTKEDAIVAYNTRAEAKQQEAQRNEITPEMKLVGSNPAAQAITCYSCGGPSGLHYDGCQTAKQQEVQGDVLQFKYSNNHYIADKAAEEFSQLGVNKIKSELLENLYLISLAVEADNEFGLKTGALVVPLELATIQIDIALASLPQPAKIATWQPIETAPKDGKWIMLWQHSYGIPVAAYWRDDNFHRGWRNINEIDMLSPILWQPIILPTGYTLQGE